MEPWTHRSRAITLGADKAPASAVKRGKLRHVDFANLRVHRLTFQLPNVLGGQGIRLFPSHAIDVAGVFFLPRRNPMLRTIMPAASVSDIIGLIAAKPPIAKCDCLRSFCTAGSWRSCCRSSPESRDCPISSAWSSSTHTAQNPQPASSRVSARPITISDLVHRSLMPHSSRFRTWVQTIETVRKATITIPGMTHDGP